MALGLAIRVVVSLLSYVSVANPDRNFGDFGGEVGWVSRSIALGHGFSSPFAPESGPTALVPPLFAYILAGIFRVFGLYSRHAALATLMLQSLLSVLTCIPVYLIARRSSGPRTARWAAFGWAVYPFAIFYASSTVWDFALTSLLFAMCFWLIQTLKSASPAWHWFGVGLLCGIAGLSNPSVLLVLAALLSIAAWRSRGTDRAAGNFVRRLCLTTLGGTLILTPWMVRNVREMHRFSPIRDGFWLEFWAGNAGDTSTSNPSWAHPATNPAEMALWLSMGENRYLASKHDLSIISVRTHPVRFAVTSGRRLVRFWTGFWSFNPEYLKRESMDLPNVPFCTALTVLMVFGLRHMWRNDRAGALPYLVSLILFPIPYYVSHASMDYRQPMETVVVLLVVRGLLRESRSRDSAACHPSQNPGKYAGTNRVANEVERCATR